MNRYFDFYFQRIMIPSLTIIVGSIALQLLSLYGVTVIEHRAGRSGPYELALDFLGGMPLWLMLICAGLIFNAFLLMRWALVFSADVGRRHPGPGWEISFPSPVLKLCAGQLFVIAGSVLAFYLCRSLIW